MPIKPENRSRYPADWPQVRERILTRAGNCCEHPDCGARNYDVGFWRKQMGRFVWHEQVRGLRTWREASQWAAEWYFGASEEGPKPTVIVLTIAHLDHQPENCADDNLRAMCQRHHLAHDHGQGRKPLAPGQASVPVCIRMTPEQRDKLAALGGPAWIRKKIDTAKVKA